MKKFTCLLIPLFFSLITIAPDTAFAQNGNAIAAECNYTDGSCLSIGYVQFEEIPGNPRRYAIAVDYFINQGGDAACPAIDRITFIPSFQNTGLIEPGEGTDIDGSLMFEVNANTFEAQDLTLTMTIDYANGAKTRVDLSAPPSFECGDITPLPVELTSFKGKATESGINLAWKTASELNNSHFDIERSADGRSFKTIGTVKGRGTTSTTSTYSFKDKLPQNGPNYYRLKQVDYDETQSYSGTIVVKWNAGDAMQAAVLPNPCANRNCSISISNAANQPTLLQLKDITGRVVFTKTIRSDKHLYELPMHELPNLKGLYFLIATTGNQVVHQRVVLN